jgi:hypothetical protein
MGVISGGKVIEGASLRLGNPAAEGAAAGAVRVARGTYSFAVDGGAVGTISLLPTTDLIPSGSVILGGFVEVTTAPTSGGAATIAVKVEGAGDIIAAAAISGAPWSTTGRKSVIPAFTGATTVKTTADRNIDVVVATAALTAGVFDVYLAYIVTA